MLKSIKTFYPSLENRNVLQLKNKYQKISYLQRELLFQQLMNKILTNTVAQSKIKAKI